MSQTCLHSNSSKQQRKGPPARSNSLHSNSPHSNSLHSNRSRQQRSHGRLGNSATVGYL
jgi:hypothetical protein